jgi:hypothetical protein
MLENDLKIMGADIEALKESIILLSAKTTNPSINNM